MTYIQEILLKNIINYSKLQQQKITTKEYPNPKLALTIAETEIDNNKDYCLAW